MLFKVLAEWANDRSVTMSFIRATALALLIVFAAYAPVAAAGDYPPRTIRAAVRLSSVRCAAGCCCGQGATIYRGYWYTTGVKGYCRWFRTLRDGQTVTATLTRVH